MSEKSASALAVPLAPTTWKTGTGFGNGPERATPSERKVIVPVGVVPKLCALTTARKPTSEFTVTVGGTSNFVKLVVAGVIVIVSVPALELKLPSPEYCACRLFVPPVG